MVLSKERLCVDSADSLRQRGYVVSERCPSRASCFDVAARKGGLVILLKVLVNIDNLQKSHAEELRMIGQSLSCSPLIVGVKVRGEETQEGVVYERHSIPAVSPPTFDEILDDKPPFVYSKRGGLYIQLDEESLKEEREKRLYSLEELASAVGVSRMAIYAYERGIMRSTLETAIRLEEALEAPLAVPIDVVSWRVAAQEEECTVKTAAETEMKKMVDELLAELGLGVLWANSAPFDAITKDEENVFLTGVGASNERGLRRRIRLVKSISMVARKLSMFVMEDMSSQSIGGVPIVSLEELEKARDPEGLMAILEDHSKKGDVAASDRG